MGKPLISDSAMRGMYDTMQGMRSAKRDAALLASLSRAERTRLLDEPESLLAALLSQLHHQDTVLTQGTLPLLVTAMAGMCLDGGAPTVEVSAGTSEECAAFAAGMALRIANEAPAAAGTEGSDGQLPRPVVVAVLQDLPTLTGVLQMIQQRDLAVLLIVSGEMESRAEAQRRLLSTKVPVMPVDRNDAVAVCRVVQESLLRARNGWGGAVIHAIAMPGGCDPLQLLRLHLEQRGILQATPSGN